jgi:hypothetical protein
MRRRRTTKTTTRRRMQGLMQPQRITTAQMQEGPRLMPRPAGWKKKKQLLYSLPLLPAPFC